MCAVFRMQHRGKRSVEASEFRVARRHCLANSFFDKEVHEFVYLGDSDDTVAAVNLALGVECVPELIPDTPKAVILVNPRGEGIFQ